MLADDTSKAVTKVPSSFSHDCCREQSATSYIPPPTASASQSLPVVLSSLVAAPYLVLLLHALPVTRLATYMEGAWFVISY